jgi:hypothetical protein
VKSGVESEGMDAGAWRRKDRTEKEREGSGNGKERVVKYMENERRSIWGRWTHSGSLDILEMSHLDYEISRVSEYGILAFPGPAYEILAFACSPVSDFSFPDVGVCIIVFPLHIEVKVILGR